jgi:hypothetical protein
MQPTRHYHFCMVINMQERYMGLFFPQNEKHLQQNKGGLNNRLFNTVAIKWFGNKIVLFVYCTVDELTVSNKSMIFDIK